MGTPLEAEPPTASGRHSRIVVAAAGAALLVVFMVLVALGTWQVHRLSWKLDLIARVDQRIAAAPLQPPAPAGWPAVTAAADEYRHVRIQGRFLEARETLVQAVTAFGGGYWVLLPFRTDAGFVVFVNRGFVSADLRDPASRRAGEIHGETAVTGLLRMSEPNGAFLRSNDAAADRWYSRDIAAIAVARDLGPVAPYFIDADDTPNPGGTPIGGLTVVAFPNNHLVYAITWYGLAALLAGATAWAVRDEWRARRRDQAAPGSELGSTSVVRTKPGSLGRNGRAWAYRLHTTEAKRAVPPRLGEGTARRAGGGVEVAPPVTPSARHPPQNGEGKRIAIEMCEYRRHEAGHPRQRDRSSDKAGKGIGASIP